MTEQRDPQVRAELIELFAGSWTTQVCATAARLGIPDAFSDGASDARAIARSVDCDEQMIRRLLRAMCCLGLVSQIDELRFELTSKGKMLRSDRRGSLKGLAIAWGTEFWDAWSQLHETVQTGRPALQDAFAQAAANPQMAAILNQSQADRSRGVAAEAARLLDLRDCKTVVDVGGGYGTVLSALLLANPATEGILVELEYLELEARAFLEREGVADRVIFRAADFFEADLPSGDLYVLKSILHDWADDEARTILLRLAGVARRGARLVVIEQTLPEVVESAPDDLAVRSAFRTDLTMMVGTTGRERTEAEFRALLGEAGFIVERVLSNASEFKFIEATRKV